MHLKMKMEKKKRFMETKNILLMKTEKKQLKDQKINIYQKRRGVVHVVIKPISLKINGIINNQRFIKTMKKINFFVN